VSGLAGIAIDEANGELWVAGTGGLVWRLGGLPVPEPSVLVLGLASALALARMRRIS
jgi:hypothetical protein